MKLEKKDLEHVLKLAHLSVSESEKSALLPDLQRILDTMKSLDKVDLNTIEPSSYAFNQEAFIREDVVEQGDDLLMEQNAPDWESGCFSVPSILGDG